MDIEKLKQQADGEMVYQGEIKALQAKAISKFETFFEIMERSSSLWNEKMKDMVNQFVSDFSKYFKQNGFSIQERNPFGDSGVITELEATYKNLTFKLSGINYETEKMYINNFQDVQEEIWIALPNNLPNYFVWKNNIDGIAGKRLVDMNGSPKDVYKQFVYQFNTEEELNQLMGKIDINISHFQESIERFHDINLCIHRFDTDETYDNFSDLIGAIE